jgi:hypothetical protein
MRTNGFNLGGEPSGHIILSDYTTTGDGLVTALQLLAVVKKLNQPVSKVCHRFDPLPQDMMKAAARYHVRFGAKDSGGHFLDVHKFVKTDRPVVVIEKQINVRIRSRLAASHRTKQIEMPDPGFLQVRFRFFQSSYNFVARHKLPSSEAGHPAILYRFHSCLNRTPCGDGAPTVIPAYRQFTLMWKRYQRQ